MIKLVIALLVFVPFQDDEEKPSQDDIEEWVEQLGADYQEERVEAFEKLKKVGKAAEDALVDAIDNDDFRVRRACLELLTELKSMKVVDEAARIFQEEEDKTVQDRAFAYLRMCGLKAEDALIEALDRDEEEYVLGALITLRDGKSQKCAEKVADIYDKSSNAEIKKTAFACLQNIGKAAKPYLLKLLGSEDASVRKGALEGLKNIKAEDDDAVDAVTKLFQKESDEAVQRIAFEYLKNKGKRAEPAFLHGLDSKVEQIRLLSIRGLTEIKSDKALEPIADSFDKDSAENVRRDALEYLKALGLKSEARLLKSLDNENPKVRLMAIEGLGAIKSEKPLERISKMFREDKDKEVHRVAFDYVKNVGMAAVDDLIHGVKDSNADIKQESIEELGKLRAEKAIDALIAVLGELNPKFRDAARDSLVHIGQVAVDAVKKAAEEGKVKAKLASQIVMLHEQEQVERILDALITEDGGTGFYEGQFKGLNKFGRDRAVKVLLKIIEPGYELRLPNKKGSVFLYDRYMKELAIMALGELKAKEALPILQKRLKERGHMWGDDEYEELVIAAFRLGDEKSFDRFVDDMKEKIKEDLKGDYKSYDRMFSLAMVQNRVGRREDALKTYRELRKVIEENKDQEQSQLYDAVLYNIACLLSLSGEKDNAVKVLEEAVKAGFKDRGWIRQDTDLAALKGMKSFEDLLKKEELFKKEDE